jgi:hypothetical protein
MNNNEDRANLSPTPFSRSLVSQTDPVGNTEINFVGSWIDGGAAGGLSCPDISLAGSFERLVNSHGNLGVPNFDLVVVAIYGVSGDFAKHGEGFALEGDHPDKIAKCGTRCTGWGYNHYAAEEK